MGMLVVGFSWIGALKKHALLVFNAFAYRPLSFMYYLFYILYLNPNLPTPFWGCLNVENIIPESITFMKVEIIVNQGKWCQIIVKRDVSALFRNNTNIQILCKLCSWIFMRLMSKSEYLIVPKGTKFMWAGKLGLGYLLPCLKSLILPCTAVSSIDAWFVEIKILKRKRILRLYSTVQITYWYCICMQL